MEVAQVEHLDLDDIGDPVLLVDLLRQQCVHVLVERCSSHQRQNQSHLRNTDLERVLKFGDQRLEAAVEHRVGAVEEQVEAAEHLVHGLFIEAALALIAPLRLHQADPRLRRADLHRHRIQAAVVLAVEDAGGCGAGTRLMLDLHGERGKSPAQESRLTLLLVEFRQVSHVNQARETFFDGLTYKVDVQLAHAPLPSNLPKANTLST